MDSVNNATGEDEILNSIVLQLQWMKKKHNQGFEAVLLEDEIDRQGRRFQETTSSKKIEKEDEMKTKCDHLGRFQETTKIIKKRRRQCEDDDDNDYEGSDRKKKKHRRKKISLNPTAMIIMDLPIIFRRRIRALGGSDAALVIQKLLFKTDVSSGHNRLSIPFNQIRQGFLTPQEIHMLNGRDRKKCSAMEVMLIEPSLHRDTISLRRWEMKKASGNSTSMYVLVGKWNSVAQRNALREHETVQLWSFRVKSKLCFALVKRRSATLRSCCSFLFGSSLAATATAAAATGSSGGP